jgi:aminoglycoside 6'-N-acetyltransferase
MLASPPGSSGPIVLRELRPDDEAELLRIHRAPAVARWWGEPDERFPWSDEPDSRRLVIDIDGRVAGLIQYHEDLEPRYRHASIDLFLDPGLRGRGVGPEAIGLLVRRLIDERGHHRITIDPATANEAAIKAYEKAGFVPVGVMRSYERDPDGGGWRDALLMELVADDRPPACARAKHA